jgi:putative ABC transport system permease protein
MSVLFRTLILRPLRNDLLRSLLTLLAVALGVAVVIAIDLAGDAAAGSFQSSLTTVVGKVDLEITATGGVDERWIGKLAALPIIVRFAPGMQAEVKIEGVGFVTVYGIDLLGAEQARGCGASPALVTKGISARLANRFFINGYPFCKAKTIESGEANFAVIDIADFQQALGRFGKLDRIDVFVEPGEGFENVQRQVTAALPAGYRIARPGARSDENQKMLRSFRWNLRILSYISLVVGAFLIYNTISISVVRRRAEIGILRALGATRQAVLSLFLLEASMFGLAGAALGLLIGRVLAVTMVGLISQTVHALYTSSTPAPIHLGLLDITLAFAAGLATALLSAWGPAREATRIVPMEAMGRGSREVRVRLRLWKNLAIAAVLAVAAWAASLPGPVDGRPIFGYLSTVLSIAAAAMSAPALVAGVNGLLRAPLLKLFGVEGLLASRGLSASLGRTSVMVAALATAIAMTSSVGIMVGSFRETLLLWLDGQLRADLYIRSAEPSSAGEFPPIPTAVIPRLRSVPGIADLDIFTAFEFHYQGQRATLGAGDLDVQRRHARLRFLSGDHDAILRSLSHHDRAIVSEPFSEKHHVHPGDSIAVDLGEHRVALTVAGIYYDYSNEQGYVIIDRTTLLKYLPDQPPTNIAVYLKQGVDKDAVRREIEERTRQFPISVAPNQTLRQAAVEIFDRTFAVTWALEGVAIFVAMLGAANCLLALVLDRRREFGMLRYLGAATSQIRRLILVEAGLIGFFALLLGAALGLVLSRLLIFVINKQSFGWTIQFHLPVAALGGAMLLIWAVTVLAGLYPARVAARLKPIEVIHEE